MISLIGGLQALISATLSQSSPIAKATATTGVQMVNRIELILIIFFNLLTVNQAEIFSKKINEPIYFN